MVRVFKYLLVLLAGALSVVLECRGDVTVTAENKASEITSALSLRLQEMRASGIPRVAADPTATDLWRKKRIRSAWHQIYPDAEPLRDKQLEDLLVGYKTADSRDLNALIGAVIVERPFLALSPVGMLFKGYSDGAISIACTVTLINNDLALTALHCFEEMDLCNVGSERPLKIYFQYEGIREIALDASDCYRISTYCDSNPNCDEDADDLAKIWLEPSYPILPGVSLDPSSMALFSSTNNDQLTLSYGKTSNLSSLPDGGILRYSTVNLSPCACPTQQDALSESGKALCYQHPYFSSNLGVAEADSGGPMLTNFDDTKIDGVARESIMCLEQTPGNTWPGESKYVNLAHRAYRAWLMEGFDPSNFSFYSSDNGLIDIYQLEPLSQLQNGQTRIYSLRVEPGVTTLIVTLNHEIGADLTPFDLDLHLVGLTGTCQRYMGAEVCSFLVPEEGSYRLLVKEGDCGPYDCNVPNEPSYQLGALAIHCSSWFCTQGAFQPLVQISPPYRVPDF